MPSARKFSTILGIVLALFACSAQAQIASQGNTFTVGDIDVDVTAADAVQARQKAIREAQQQGIKRLVERMVPAEGRARFGPEQCPIALWEYDAGRLLATFPDFGDGVKIGVHHEGEITTPQRCRRTIGEDEDAQVRALLERCLPDAAGSLADSAVCLYTNTPDHHFVIDRHPASRRVIVVSPCSGHGFKFASVVGELSAQLALDEQPAFDLEPFRLARLGPASH